MAGVDCIKLKTASYKPSLQGSNTMVSSLSLRLPLGGASGELSAAWRAER